MENFNNDNQLLRPSVMPQLISITEVMKCTGLSRATIYRMIDSNSKHYDPTFPKKVQLSQVRIAWVSSEIADWINAKIGQRVA